MGARCRECSLARQGERFAKENTNTNTRAVSQFIARRRNVAICPRVTKLLGQKSFFVASQPLVMPAVPSALMFVSWMESSSSTKPSVCDAAILNALTRNVDISARVTSFVGQNSVPATLHPLVMPAAATALMAASYGEPLSSVNRSGPAGSFNAFVRNVAICPRVTESFGQ